MYTLLVVAGNLGNDPELRTLPSGSTVCNFSVASNRRWTDSNGTPQEQVTWFRVTAWNRLGEICNEFLTKGSKVLIEAEKIEARGWTDNSGEAKSSLEITARSVKFLSRADAENGIHPNDGGQQQQQQVAPTKEIPF